MKKILLTASTCCLFLLSYGQQARWVTGPATNLQYDFGTGTGSAGTVFTGTSVNSVSTPTTSGFLPRPNAGIAKVATGSTGTPIFTLDSDGETDTLKFQASSTANVGKLSMYDIPGATALTAAYVTLNFDNNEATGGDFKLATGYSTTTGSMFNNTSGIGNSNTTSLPEVFACLRWQISSTDVTKMNAAFRVKANATDATTFTSIPFVFNRGTAYALEILCNNTATSQDYTRSGVTYSVPSRTYEVWANGTRLTSTGAGVYGFPANQLAVGTAINAFLIQGVSSSGPGNPNSPALVTVDGSGNLVYETYSNQNETNKVNVVPDFSSAGYMGGGVQLPTIAVQRTLSPLAGDNLAQIQNALNEVGALPLDANGHRGAVLLQAGLYEVNSSLYISNSGVVLRGVGQGSNAASNTILRATQPLEHTFIQVQGTGSGLGEVGGTRTPITTAYVPTGAMSFDVASAAGYVVGDAIAVYKVPNDFWIDDLAMRQYGWLPGDYDMAYERTIVAISGNTVTINAPVIDPIQNKYGGGFIYKTNITGRLSNAGVENMRLTSIYASDTDENHGWEAVKLRRAVNCWVKKVTAQYFGYSCVTLSTQSSNNSIEECAMLDPKSQTTGGRKYSFNLAGGQLNLFQRCYTRSGRHDFVTGAQIAGPNVFLDCYASDTKNQSGPHQRWAVGTLFDNIYAGALYVENRKASGTGHGWAGAQTLFWNSFSYKEEVAVHSPKGAMNWSLGTTGLTRLGNGYFSSWGTPILPRSLYLAQLKQRLGQAAVDNVTTPAQRSGSLQTQLGNWAGEGSL